MAEIHVTLADILWFLNLFELEDSEKTMDQKSWLWKKRSTEKTLIADKASNSLSKYEEEVNEVCLSITYYMSHHGICSYGP